MSVLVFCQGDAADMDAWLSEYDLGAARHRARYLSSCPDRGPRVVRAFTDLCLARKNPAMFASVADLSSAEPRSLEPPEAASSTPQASGSGNKGEFLRLWDAGDVDGAWKAALQARKVNQTRREFSNSCKFRIVL